MPDHKTSELQPQASKLKLRKITSLLRATLSEGMNLFTYRAKDQKSQRVLPLVLASLVFFTIFGSATTMVKTMQATGTAYAILSMFTVATAVLTLMEGIYKSSSLLFLCRDNDLLLSLPIPKWQILFTRVCKFYLFELMYNSIFLGPAILAYIVNVSPAPSFYLVSVLMLLLLPIIPVALSCILGAFTSALSLRVKHKNLAQVLYSFLFLFAVVLGSALFNNFIDGLSTSAGQINASLVQIYYPAQVFVSLVTSFSFIKLINFILLNLAVLAFTVFLISKFYFRITSKLAIHSAATLASKDSQQIFQVPSSAQISTKASPKTKLCPLLKSRTYFSPKSPLRAVVRKELSRYFSTPVLITNTAMGFIIFLVATVALCLKFDDFATYLASQGFPFSAEDLKFYVPTLVYILATFSSLMTFITTTSFSLEGPAFNLLKSLPISGQKVIAGKILASLILIVPPTFLGVLIAFVFFRFSLLHLLLITVSTVLLPLVTETVGILIDLRYARFDAESDAEIVKQSPGIMVASFSGLGATVLTISLIFALSLTLSQTLSFLLVNALFFALFAFLFFHLKSKAEQKYLSLVA